MKQNPKKWVRDIFNELWLLQFFYMGSNCESHSNFRSAVNHLYKKQDEVNK